MLQVAGRGSSGANADPAAPDAGLLIRLRAAPGSRQYSVHFTCAYSAWLERMAWWLPKRRGRAGAAIRLCRDEDGCSLIFRPAEKLL